LAEGRHDRAGTPVDVLGTGNATEPVGGTDHVTERGDADADWRTAPPPVGETPVAPADAVSAAPGSAPDDPRRWDVPDDRWTSDADPGGPARGVDGARAASATGIATEEVPVTAPELVHEEEVTERGYSPGQILVALAGAAALALGIAALVATGVETPLDDPVEPVLGWDHTALLGLLEIGAGALMLLSSLRAGARWFGGLVGLAVIAGGVLVVGQFDDDIDRWIVDELGAERTFGWVAIGIGAAAVIGALIPRVRRTRRISTTTSAAA